MTVSYESAVFNLGSTARVVTNYKNLLGGENPGYLQGDLLEQVKVGFFAKICECLRIKKCYDIVVFYQAPFSVYIFILVLLNILIPLNKVKIISIDFQFSPAATSFKHKMREKIWRFVWARVDLVIGHMKFDSALLNVHGVRESNYEYVPYKVNGFENIADLMIRDDGYIFTGGYSWRDYQTFSKAMERVDYPAKLVTLTPDKSLKHGTDVSNLQVPSNVEVIYHDGDPNSWRNYIAGAALVVIPVSKMSLCSNGVSLYLSAMGMGKCVIVSDCPAVKGIVVDGRECVIVPSEDPDALAEAIERVLRDESWKNAVAQRGKGYADSLGGNLELSLRLCSVIRSRINLAAAPLVCPQGV